MTSCIDSTSSIFAWGFLTHFKDYVPGLHSLDELHYYTFYVSYNWRVGWKHNQVKTFDHPYATQTVNVSALISRIRNRHLLRIFQITLEMRRSKYNFLDNHGIEKKIRVVCWFQSFSLIINYINNQKTFTWFSGKWTPT